MPAAPSTAKRAGFDCQLKLLVVGDSAVGKTSLLLRYTDSKFSSSYVSTIGIDFKAVTLDLDGQAVKLQIWDTAGQERFRTITTSYFRGANAVMLAFDATDRKTFNNVSNWASQIAEHADEGVSCMLVSTKTDMTDKIVVTDKEGQAVAAQYGFQYMATSAKLGSNVKEAFESLARTALKKYIASNASSSSKKSGTIDPKAKSEAKGGKCC